MTHLLTLGYGYSAQALTRRLLAKGWSASGTTRDAALAQRMSQEGVTRVLLPDDLGPALARASHILISAAPDETGDPFLRDFGAQIRAARPAWVGYLSTTSVYGDRGGDWVDETDALRPETERGRERVLAEEAWLASGLPAHVFRLAGIYGPGRGPLEKARRGGPAVVKPGQVFGRIHVDDIAQVLEASIRHPHPGRIYNVCDDEPAPAEEVLDHAAALLGLPAPRRVAFDPEGMSEMARSFYAECKRVRNDRIKTELGVQLLYPTYREGLAAQIAASG